MQNFVFCSRVAVDRALLCLFDDHREMKSIPQYSMLLYIA